MDEKVVCGSVLIVEDDFFIADDLADALRRRGATVVGPFGTLGQAQTAIDTLAFDCAVLDLNLHGELAFDIAETLDRKRVPVFLASGYDADSIPKHLRHIERVEKPYDVASLAGKVCEVISILHENKRGLD
jgi:DNA-binding response OmpR family regulator